MLSPLKPEQDLGYKMYKPAVIKTIAEIVSSHILLHYHEYRCYTQCEQHNEILHSVLLVKIKYD